MLAWSIALLLIAGCATVGFYVGAVRVGITTLGLLVTLFFLKPLTALAAKLLPMVGVTHPGLQLLLGAAIVFVVIQIIAKASARALQPIIEKHYKYEASDTQRLLFERLNQRTGPALGIVNACLYFLLLAIAGLGIGYTSVQYSRGPQQDGFVHTTLNNLARGLQSAGLHKVVGGYMPASSLYFDLVDVTAEWFHQPLIQSRLATYPPFITLGERPEFQAIGSDVALQQFLAKSPTINEIIDHPKLGKLFSEWSIADRALAAVNNDLADLTGYVRTGKSAKYDEEKILGRWDFNLSATVAENKKLKRMSGLEVNKMLGILNNQITGSELLATTDGKIIIRRTPPGGTQTRFEGTWKAEGSGKYALKYNVSDDKSLELSCQVEGRKFTATLNNYPIVFEKW